MKGGDFKSDFNEAIDRLQQTQSNVSGFISQNEAFSKQIVQNLADINGRIRNLSAKILEIRSTLAEKEKEIASKQGEINNNNSNVSALQRQIDESRTQQQESQQQLQQHKETIQGIYTESTRQRDDLNNQLLGQKREIEDLKQKIFTDEQEAKNLNYQLAEKNSIIADLQKRLNDFDQHVKSEAQNADERKKQLENSILEFQNTIRNMNEQIRQLEGVNNQLQNEIQEGKQMIVRATGALNSAISTLVQLQNNTNQTEIKSAIDEIQNSLKTIELSLNTTSSSPSFFSPGSSSSSAATSPPTVGKQYGRSLNDIYSGYSQQTLKTVKWKGIEFGEIIRILYNKPAFNTDGANNSKYYRAFYAIMGAKGSINESSLTNIFNIYRITDLNTNELEGGKRSKKSRKTKKKLRRRRQKGGYQYNEKSKRRRFTTSIPNSSRISSSRTSSRTSSKTTSLHKDKSQTRKTL